MLGTPRRLRRNNKQTVAARRTPGESKLVRRASVGRGKERLNLARLETKSEAVRRPASTVVGTPMLVLMRAHGHLCKAAAPQPRSVETSTAAYYVWHATFFTEMSSCQRRLECCARIGIRRHDLGPRRSWRAMTTVLRKRQRFITTSSCNFDSSCLFPTFHVDAPALPLIRCRDCCSCWWPANNLSDLVEDLQPQKLYTTSYKLRVTTSDCKLEQRT